MNIVVFGADEKETLSYRVQTFVSDDGKDVAGNFKGLRVTDVPCGAYHYTLMRSASNARAGIIEGTILLNNPEQRLTLRADPSVVFGDGVVFEADGPPPSTILRGRLIGASAGGSSNRWARLMSISHHSFEEVEISTDGTFEFNNVWPDAYVLLVLEPQQMLASKFVLVRLQDEKLTVEVTLEKRASPK